MFEHLISKEVALLTPYSPGKPIEEVKRELGLSEIIKLASNENPLGPSPKAREAVVKAAANLHRYPDGSGYELKKALAAKTGFNPENFVLGNGSDEIIEFCARAFITPGKHALMSNPTFLFYSKAVQAVSGRVAEVPLKGLRHDLVQLQKQVNENTALIFIDNPNNPSGSYLAPRELQPFLGDLPRTAVVALDEAYRDFVRGEDLIDVNEIIQSGRPVIFLRTFSKAYGLAGLRVGYGISHPELAGYLDRVRQPFNMSSLAMAGAAAALEDKEFYDRTIEITWSGLDWLWAELDKLGLKYRRSHTNYFLIELDMSGDEAFRLLLKEGIITRSMEGYGLARTIRLTVGLPEENRKVIQALKKITRR